MLIKNPFIGIAGNIGVGKTTFTEVLAKKYNWDDRDNIILSTISP